MAKKKKAGKKKTPKPLPQRKKFGDKTYKKASCSKKESAANTKAETHRKKNSRSGARVLKDPVTGNYCVFTYG